MITILTWIELLKRAGKTEKEAVKEIASTSFGGQPQRVYSILQVAGLPKELQILIKEPRERTEEEKHILEEHDIKPDFKMNFTTLGVVGAITEHLAELSPLERAEKIFGIIKDFSFEGKSWLKQYEVLGSIRDKLKEGKTFDIVMNEVKQELKIFTIARVKAIRVKIPEEYALWHRRACARAGLKGEELVLQVYLSWLENEARKEGW